jgi:hypothetical protein
VEIDGGCTNWGGDLFFSACRANAMLDLFPLAQAEIPPQSLDRQVQPSKERNPARLGQRTERNSDKQAVSAATKPSKADSVGFDGMQASVSGNRLSCADNSDCADFGHVNGYASADVVLPFRCTVHLLLAQARKWRN